MIERFKQQKCHGKVADAVDDVEGNSGCPPGKGGSGTACKKVGNSTEQSEEHAEDSGKQCGGNWPRFTGPSHEKHGCTQECPYVEIRKPPEAEAVDQSLQNDEYIEDEPDMAAEYEGIQNQQERHQLDIV